MDFFIETALNGLTLGAVYASLALAVSLVYGVTGALSFAPGGVFLLGSLLCMAVAAIFAPLGAVVAPVVLTTALVCAIGGGAGAGWLLGRGGFFAASRTSLVWLIASAGLLFVAAGTLQFAPQLRIPNYLRVDPRPVLVAFIPGLLNFRIPATAPAVIAVAACAIVAIAYTLRRTNFGLSARSVFQDAGMAELCGLDAARIQSICILTSCALAAAAGWMLVLDEGPLNPQRGMMAVFYGFAAAVAAGLGSISGAVAAGLVLGFAQAFWSGFFGESYAGLPVFSALIFALRFLPDRAAARRVTRDI